MSHELRTPMNGVLGMTDILLESDLDPLQRDCAETVSSSGKALLNLLNYILDFSKIESGKLEFSEEKFSLRGCLISENVRWCAAESKQRKAVSPVAGWPARERETNAATFDARPHPLGTE